MKKKSLLLILVSLLALVVAACGKLDVIADHAPKALDQLLAKYPRIIKAEQDGSYRISVDSKTYLLIAKDFAKGNQDIAIQTPLKDFENAGLDKNKLPAGYSISGDNLILSGDYGNGSGVQDTPRKAIFQAVAFDRKMLTYHTALDHYGIKLPAGKFEYAKDEAKNDKDIVFVLAAKPFADLGVKVNEIQGWIFKTMKDENGKDIDVLLKPYDMK